MYLKPKHTRVAGTLYDSHFESEVARILRHHLGKPYYSITRQIKVKVRPKSNHFDAKYWKCDFMIQYLDTSVYIEAKGFSDASMYDTVAAVDLNEPEIYDRLIIVVPDNLTVPSRWQQFGSKIILFSELRSWLQNWILENDKYYFKNHGYSE
jgi:predicted nuclease of restriction endonuclease-like RecB superfamily